VEKGAEVNAVRKNRDGNPSTPLCWAARAMYHGKEGGPALTQLLVGNGATINTVGKHDNDGNPSIPLAQAANAGEEAAVALVRLIVSAGAKLVDTEKAAHQGTVDGVMGTRNKLAD
jgi:hypothetical protein